MPRIERTPRSAKDAVDIWLYIARDNEAAADRLIDSFQQRLQSLAEMPLSGEAVFFIAPDVRFSSVGSYVIYYRPIDDGIQCLRILHGARQPEELL